MNKRIDQLENGQTDKRTNYERTNEQMDVWIDEQMDNSRQTVGLMETRTKWQTNKWTNRIGVLDNKTI